MTDEQIKALVQLKELKEQGILSQEEFEKEKANILNDKYVVQSTIQEAGSVQSEPSIDNDNLDNRSTTAIPVVKETKKTNWWKEHWWIFAFALASLIAKLLY